MLLAEELMLLLLDDDKGTMSATASMKIDTVLGGAVLVELALAERVAVTARKPGGKPDRLAIPDSTPTGDPLLDDALGRLVDRAGKSVTDAVATAGKGAKAAVTDRLVAAGALTYERRRVLGLFPSRTLPAGDPGWESEVRSRIGRVLDGAATPDERSGALIGLLLATDLLDLSFPLDDRSARKERKARAEKIGAGDWASAATKQALKNAQAAMIAIGAAVMVPIVAGGATG